MTKIQQHSLNDEVNMEDMKVKKIPKMYLIDYDDSLEIQELKEEISELRSQISTLEDYIKYLEP